MNAFDRKLKEIGRYPLRAEEVSTLQLNITYKCNLRCTHCHIEATPDRQEEMSLDVMNRVIEVLKENREINTVDITGGSPELHPYFKYLVSTCYNLGKDIMVRTNLAVYSEPDMDDIPEFLAKKRVKIIASLPCYTEENVDRQRGKGTYKKAIEGIKRLNALGYGKEGTGLELDIMFNPLKEGIAPDQKMLEKAYKEKLYEMHGITFNRLIALSNMPIGRLGKSLSESEYNEYIETLKSKFNPDTVDGLMCRYLISVSPWGNLHDCDFWQALRLPVVPEHRTIYKFDYDALKNREIVTNVLCFMCTAGAGASCTGALT